MMDFAAPTNVVGLPPEESAKLAQLVKVYKAHRPGNEQKNKYYEGAISLNDVNLGIALPEGMRGLEIGCAWGAKCVDVLAARSMFDGFVGVNGESVEELDRIVTANNLIAQ